MATANLQPPGAGLPWWELWVARHLVFPYVCWRTRWEESARLFQAEGLRVLQLWDQTPAADRLRPVLIRRVTGIEDSSRNWSIVMTVEHLTIVGRGIHGIIAGLRAGQVRPEQVRIQDVKPTGNIAPEVVRAEFEHLLADTAAAEAVEPAIPAGAGPRYQHPWFGPIDAHQWHCLLGIHQQIHRKQIEAIRAQLRSS